MMEDPNTVILDISSDEEEDFTKTRGIGGVGGGGSDDYGWITELMDEDGDDSGDVVVILKNSESEQNLRSVTSAKWSPVKAVNEDDDDDDCVVLDEDPDKPVAVEDDKRDDSDDDDVLLVSEKGQVACRDYPHSRHLCAKFPFGSTPHERHCIQCHCYVCDSLAPCVYWGTGISSVDHCHATDKDEYWEGQRRGIRISNKFVSEILKGPDTSLSVPPPLAHQAPSSTQITSYYLPQNQKITQASIRPCSLSNSGGLPNLTRQQHNAIRVSQQLHSISANFIPREGRDNVGHMRPQFVNSRTTFKRAGSIGQSLTTNRCGYNPSHINSGPQFLRNHSSVTRLQEPYGWEPAVSNKYPASSQPYTGSLGAIAPPTQPQLPTRPSVWGVSTNYTRPEPQVHSYPQALVGNSHNSLASEAQLFSQPYANDNPVGDVPQQTPLVFHPEQGNAFQNPTCSPSQLIHQANPGTTSGNSNTPVSKLTYQPDGGTSFRNSAPSQGHLPYPPKVGYQSESVLSPSFEDFEFSWEQTSVSQTNNVDHVDNPKQAEAQSSEVTRHDQFSESTITLENQYDNWLFENLVEPGDLDVPVPSGLDVLSPENPSIDSWNLF